MRNVRDKSDFSRNENILIVLSCAIFFIRLCIENCLHKLPFFSSTGRRFSKGESRNTYFNVNMRNNRGEGQMVMHASLDSDLFLGKDQQMKILLECKMRWKGSFKRKY
jgi:hypothetical protein